VRNEGKGPLFRGSKNLFPDRLDLRIRLLAHLLPEDLPINLILVQSDLKIPVLGQKKHLSSMAGLVEGVEGQGTVQKKNGLRNVAPFLVEPDKVVDKKADPHQKLLPHSRDPVLELFAVREEETIHEGAPNFSEGASHSGLARGANFRVMEK
jgi:hypothetical protein